jgi:hypothetical protein
LTIKPQFQYQLMPTKHADPQIKQAIQAKARF